MEEKIINFIEENLRKELEFKEYFINNRKIYKYEEKSLLFEIVITDYILDLENILKNKPLENQPITLKFKKCDSEDILYSTKITYPDKENFEITIDFSELANNIKQYSIA